MIITIPTFRIIKTLVTKNKMVNNGNSDDSKKNEGNKNNSQKITLCQS